MEMYALEQGGLNGIAGYDSPEGAVVVDPERPFEAKVIPKDRSFTLDKLVTQAGDTIAVEAVKFHVVKPPKPSLSLYINGKPYQDGAPINRNSILSL